MSFRQFFEKSPDRRYLMFGGKGGLGKTTFSAAAAYHLAKQGKKVLMASLDVNRPAAQEQLRVLGEQVPGTFAEQVVVPAALVLLNNNVPALTTLAPAWLLVRVALVIQFTRLLEARICRRWPGALETVNWNLPPPGSKGDSSRSGVIRLKGLLNAT